MERRRVHQNRGAGTRKVRLATVHYKPTGKSPRENCEE